MMCDHELRLIHRRFDVVIRMGEHGARSDVEVTAASSDLTEAWRELLSRLPRDVYAALRAAMWPADE